MIEGRCESAVAFDDVDAYGSAQFERVLLWTWRQTHVFATRLLSRHEAAPMGLRCAALCQRDRLPAEMRESIEAWLMQHGVPPGRVDARGSSFNGNV